MPASSPVPHVPQRAPHDCGVACAAMTCGTSYYRALQAFLYVGLDVKYPRKPLSSNFKDLCAALEALGGRATRRKFSTWQDLPDRAVLKVQWPGQKRDWHWVFARRQPEHEIWVHDPAEPQPWLWTPERCASAPWHPIGHFLVVQQP